MYNNEHLFDYLFPPPLRGEDIMDESTMHNTCYTREEEAAPITEEQIARHEYLKKEIILLAKLHSHRQPWYKECIEVDWTEKRLLGKALEEIDRMFLGRGIFGSTFYRYSFDIERSFEERLKFMDFFVEHFKEFTILFSSRPKDE